MCRQQFALNYSFSIATWPRALIFDMRHCLVDFYQVCGGTRVQNGPMAGGLGFENEI